MNKFLLFSILAACSVVAVVLPLPSMAVEPPPPGGYPNGNTAVGDGALSPDNPPSDNTAVGYNALYGCAGEDETAVGAFALQGSTTGEDDVAVGFDALYSQTSGHDNVAVGATAMVSNTTGRQSVAVGSGALEAGTTAYGNVACGYGTMFYNTAGSTNVAIGFNTMATSSGSENTAVGPDAMNGANGSMNTSIGGWAGLHLAGNGNIVMGYYAAQNVTTGANNIEIGNLGTSNDNAAIRLGDIKTQTKTFIAGISGTTVAGGAAVMINSKGQLGVATSSARFKDNIQPMKDASHAILSLQPVTFRYKKDIDSAGIPQFGLVAEDVAKVDPDLVIRDDAGKPFTVRYEAVNAMLLNEFLKEHRQVEAQNAAIAAQQGEIAELRAELKSAVVQIQKVSAQVQGREHPLIAAQN